MNYTKFSIKASLLAGILLISNTALGKAVIDTLKVEARTSGVGPDKKGFSQWRSFSTLTVDQLHEDAMLSKPIATNKYGSRMDKKGTPTGYFHTQKIDGRWDIIDPEGYVFYCKAMNSINTGTSETNKRALSDRFGSDKKWMAATVALVRDNGFNMAGSWSDVEQIVEFNKGNPAPLAYTVMLNWMAGYGKKRGGTYTQPGHTGYPNNTIFAFDEGFKSYCDEQAKELVKYKNDPNFFGYFSDNEMPMTVKNLEDYLSLPDKKDAGYLAAKKWIDDNHISESAITDQNKADFLAFVAQTYYSVVSSAIKKYDPNHMYIGSRLYGSEKRVPEFFKAAGKYIDIISVNHYHVWSPTPATVDRWTEWSGKPFMITEYYAKGMDAPGLANTTGAGWVVKTQQDRGLFYQNFGLDLLMSKNCVGWHWFKYRDNDPTDKKADPSNSDSNKGIVDNQYQPFEPLLILMKQLNTKTYQLLDHFDTLSK